MPPKTKEDLERILKAERDVLRRKRREFVTDLEVTLAAIQMSERAGCDDDAFCKFVRYTATNYANLAELMENSLRLVHNVEEAQAYAEGGKPQ